MAWYKCHSQLRRGGWVVRVSPAKDFFYFFPMQTLNKSHTLFRKFHSQKKYSPVCPMCICTKTIRYRDPPFFSPYLQPRDSLNDAPLRYRSSLLGFFLVRGRWAYRTHEGVNIFFFKSIRKKNYGKIPDQNSKTVFASDPTPDPFP